MESKSNQCNFCHQEITIPFELQCQHKMCQKCADITKSTKISSKNTLSHEFTCFTCQNKTILNDEIFKQMISNQNTQNFQNTQNNSNNTNYQQQQQQVPNLQLTSIKEKQTLNTQTQDDSFSFREVSENNLENPQNQNQNSLQKQSKIEQQQQQLQPQLQQNFISNQNQNQEFIDNQSNQNQQVNSIVDNAFLKKFKQNNSNQNKTEPDIKVQEIIKKQQIKEQNQYSSKKSKANLYNFSPQNKVKQFNVKPDKQMDQNIKITQFQTDLKILGQLSNVCQVHNEEFSLFCMNDQVFACMECVYVDQQHQNHQLIPIKQTFDILRKENNNQSQKFQQTHQTLEESLRKCKQVRKQIKQQSEINLTLIEEEFQLLQKQVNERFQKLKQFAENYYQTQFDTLSKYEINLQSSNNVIQKFRDFEFKSKITGLKEQMYLFQMQTNINQQMKNHEIMQYSYQLNSLQNDKLIVDFNMRGGLYDEIHKFGILKPKITLQKSYSSIQLNDKQQNQSLSPKNIYNQNQSGKNNLNTSLSQQKNYLKINQQNIQNQQKNNPNSYQKLNQNTQQYLVQQKNNFNQLNNSYTKMTQSYSLKQNSQQALLLQHQLQQNLLKNKERENSQNNNKQKSPQNAFNNIKIYNSKSPSQSAQKNTIFKNLQFSDIRQLSLTEPFEDEPLQYFGLNQEQKNLNQNLFENNHQKNQPTQTFDNTQDFEELEQAIQNQTLQSQQQIQFQKEHINSYNDLKTFDKNIEKQKELIEKQKSQQKSPKKFIKSQNLSPNKNNSQSPQSKKLQQQIQQNLSNIQIQQSEENIFDSQKIQNKFKVIDLLMSQQKIEEQLKKKQENHFSSFNISPQKNPQNINQSTQTQFQNSIILDEQKINNLLLPLFNGIKYSKLLYSLQQDGNSSKIFHQKCDGPGPFIVLIQVDQTKIFGYFIDIPIASNEGYTPSQNCAIFVLQNHLFNSPQLFKVKQEQKFIAFYQNQKSPILGSTLANKQDLWINFDEPAQSCSNIGYAYNKPPQIEGSQLLAGQYSNWNVDQIEVFKVEF